MKISKAFGIDLGTTRSLIGVMNVNDKEILLWHDENGKATIPSLVQWDKAKKRFKVGDDVLLTYHREPYPISSIKREMGLDKVIEHAGKKYKPKEISAEILKFLKACGQELAADHLNAPEHGLSYLVDRAIVTIPAYFDQPKIEATNEAAKLAGLETLTLLHEPTAAAIYYCWKNNIQDGVFMVYDLGGGTFDVSILKRESGNFSVLGIAGDNFLGGDTFDRALADYIIHKLDEGKYNMKLEVDKDPLDKARFNYFARRAEGIKTNLSSDLQYLFADSACPLKDKDGKSIIVEQKISRAIFEKLIAKDVLKTIDICKEAVENAKEKAKGTFKGLQDVDHILLVGGSTWIPFVKKTLTEHLCAKEGETNRAKCAEVTRESPDECVAMGAALLAASKGGLIYRDEEKNISLHIEGASISGEEEYRIRGQVYWTKEKKKQPSFEGYILTLIQDEDPLDDAEIDQHGRFNFEEIVLEDNEASKVTLNLSAPDGELLSSFSRYVSQGKHIDKEGVSVNSRSIWIYVKNSKGVQEKLTILKKGEPLPCKVASPVPIATTNPDYAGFFLHQGNTEIKKVFYEFEEEQPLGSKIDFQLSVDEKGNIEVAAQVGDLDPFYMELTPPPPPPPPDRKVLKKLQKEFDAAKQETNPVKRKRMEVKAEKITKDFERALDTGDDALAQERMRDYESLLADMNTLAENLTPPQDRFDKKAREVESLIHQNLAKIPNADDILLNLKTRIDKGHTAYKKQDQQDLTEAWEAIKDLEEHLIKLLAPKGSEDLPPLHLILPMLIEKLIHDLRELIRECKDQQLIQQAEQQVQRLKALPKSFPDEETAKRSIPEVRKAYKFIERMERMMGRAPSKKNLGIPGI